MSRNPLIFLLLAGLMVVGCGKNDPPEQARPERTVIVYMAASNNLESYALDNINQMEKAITGKDQQLLVYIDVRGKTPRVLKITHDTSAEIVSPAVINYANHNSASAAVLKQVLEDIRAAYPAASYGLIMWSHASSWMPPGTRPVTESFGDDGGEQMDIRELKNALPGTYEYIIFDACSMASVEVLYELRNKTERILAAPTETLASGMPYDLVLPYLFTGRDGLQTVAKKYVEYYQEYGEEEDSLYRSATITLVDTRQLNQLASSTRAVLENATFSDPDYHREEIQRLDFEYIPATESYDFMDFFRKNLPSEDLQPLATQLEKTVLFSQYTDEFLGRPIKTFSGLTCYIPHAGDDLLNAYYSSLEWSQASGFDLLVK